MPFPALEGHILYQVFDIQFHILTVDYQAALFVVPYG